MQTEFLPVQELPVLSSPAVLKLLGVHPTNLVKIGFINAKQAEAVDLPVACNCKRVCTDHSLSVLVNLGLFSKTFPCALH